MSGALKNWLTYLIVCGVGVAIIIVWPPGSWFVPDIVLDGQFEDWQGRSFLADAFSDALPGQDLRAIFWGTNRNERKLYFLLERFDPPDRSSPLICRLFFDINNNGHYEDLVDKFVEVTYYPGHGKPGEVKVDIYRVAGDLIASSTGLWGESAGAGGRRLEFSVSMDKLYISPPQVVRFYVAVAGLNGDRMPDGGDIQWAPFPVINIKNRLILVAGFLFWVAGAAFFHRSRIWVFYYIWGAVGFTFLLTLLMRGSLVEYKIEHYIGTFLHYLLSYLGITTYVFDKSPGTILVLIKVDNSWTTTDIDIESSGLLEIAIYIGLIIFYPVFNKLEKLIFSTVGTILINLINIVRLIVVIFAIHWGGRNLYFISHTFFGRIVFFALIVALYWYFLTRPSLQKVREQIKENA